MAIYHLHLGHISRSTGRSAVQNASYITRSALYETRRDIPVNFSNRSSDVQWTQTFAPDFAHLEFKDLGVWDKLESFEDEYALIRYPNDEAYRDKYMDSARVAMTVEVSLPRELSMDISIEMLEEFIDTQFISKNLIVTAAIHDDEGNPHAHLLISRRSLVQDEMGNQTFSRDKNRNMCLKSSLLSLRKNWADLSNSYLEREGFEERISEKSFADMGLHLRPSKHRGWISDKLKDKGIDSRIVEENEKIFAENKERILNDPTLILQEITENQAAFTQKYLLKMIQKRIGDDPVLISMVFEKALQHAVYLGEGMDGMMRYTTHHYVTIEQKTVSLMKTFLSKPCDRVVSHDKVLDHLNMYYAHMTDEQKNATLGLLKGDFLSVLLGRAGTGKTTTTVKAICELYQQSDYTVIGGSLSKLASDNLQKEAGISTKTIQAWLYCWDKYEAARQNFLSFDCIINEGILKQLDWYKDLKSFEKFAPTSKTIFIVDEAGMMGTDQWRRILEHLHRVGARVIAVGDDAQCKAIGAGDIFREMIVHMKEHGSIYELNTIMRQKVEWMKEASEQLSNLNIQEALSSYEQNDRIHQCDEAYLYEDIAKAYVAKLRDSSRDEKGNKLYNTGLVLASTNEQVDLLNKEIRSAIRVALLEDHALSRDVLTLGKGDKARHFAIGDKIIFLKNDKKNVCLADNHGVIIKDRHISNGTTGILKKVIDNGRRIEVKIDDQTTAYFSIHDYKAFDYGYAMTIHKNQGQTMDFVQVLASPHMDAMSCYVSMTRHRYAVDLFYSKDDFKTFKELSAQLSRYGHKDLAKDYTINGEHKESWERVQAYQRLIQDAAHVYGELICETDADWEPYWDIMTQKNKIGLVILDYWDKHEVYMKQAGLTHETLQIAMNKKIRPLSIAEERAKLTVEIYVETAQVARNLWNRILTLPQKKEHPYYDTFKNMCAERNALAKEILDNYQLYGEFLRAHGKGYSKKTLHNQLTYKEEGHHHDRLEQTFDFNTNTKANALNANLTKGLATPPTHFFNETKDFSNTKKQISFNRTSADIMHALNNNIKDLAIHFLDRPTHKTACQWRFGRKGSISIYVHGVKQGLYSNFETGVSGNAITLIADQRGCDRKEAFKWAIEWLGDNHALTSLHPSTLHKSKNAIKPLKDVPSPRWTPIYPAPHIAPDLRADAHLRYMMKGRFEVARYAYKDSQENLLGYVVRLEDKNGHKITPTLTYCKDEGRVHQWRWQGFGDNRPIYGLDKLAQKPNAPVIIVEGEKTCDAARHLFPNHAVVTWSGGCGAVHKTDWSPLKNREITIWPDHDQVGLKAALKIGDILKEQGIEHIKCIDLPSTLANKWDLSDEMPKHTTLKALMAHTKTHEEMVFIHYQKTNPRYDRTFNIQEIVTFAQKNRSGHLILEENAPFMEYIANEAFKELKNMTSLCSTQISEEEIKHCALFTSIYTTRFKEIAEQHKDKQPLNVLYQMGVLASKMNLNGNVVDHNVVLKNAKQEWQHIHQKISDHLKSPPQSIKDAPFHIQEGLLRYAYRFKIITGQNMASHITKDLYHGLLEFCSSTPDARMVKGVLDYIVNAKAHGMFDRSALNHTLVSCFVKQRQMNQHMLQQKTREHIQQIEHQRTLNLQLQKAIELS